jgi:flagellar biosynthesis protein FlhF
MNVMRFNGKDNRSALAQVRQALGPDALILSNRRTESGVEICAVAELPDLSAAKPAPVAPLTATTPPTASTPAAVAASPNANELALAQLKRELAGLRATLQEALGERKWQDSAGKRPVLATVEQRLGTLGIGREVASQLTADLPANIDLNSAWSTTLQKVVAGIDSLTPAEVEGLRIKALIGPSGAGKTVAALAIIEASLQRLAAADIAVISFAESALTDPLAMHCEEHAIKYLRVTDRKSLTKALSQCAWAREIIVDTRGLNLSKGSQDPVLAALSGQRAGLTALLTVPATEQREYLLRLGEHVANLPVAGVIVSKYDEAVTIGPMLDILLGDALPIAGRLDTTCTKIVSVSAQEMIQKAKSLARSALQRQAKQLKVAV